MKQFKITICHLMIFICSNISFANGDQVAYRWRNDNGDVYSATWKDSVNTPVALTDYENIRLRIEDLVGNADTSNISLRCTEDLFNANWIPITNDDTGKFVISPSQYLIDTMSYYDNQLLPPFYQDHQYRRTIAINSSTSYLLISEDLSIYEFEYSIKPTSKIKPGSAYFFSCFMDSALMHSWEVNEYAVLMTPPISWKTKTIENGYYYIMTDVCFIDANNGTAVGVNQMGGGGIILRTTDGGESWIDRTSQTYDYLSSICFINENVGIIIGSGGTILRTTNGGQDWFLHTILPGSLQILSGISFSDENYGTIVGGYSSGHGIIFRTTNGGQNWFEQVCPTYRRLSSVHFINSDIGAAVGEYGTILRTTNGGQNWFFQSSGTTNDLNSICFTDVNNGTVVGIDWNLREGIILRTTDGGNTWIKIIDRGVPSLYDLHFANNNIGWVTGDCGWILKTTDGGTSWNKLNTGAQRDLRAIHFIDSETGWAVGFNQVLKTTNGGITGFIPEDEKKKHTPENFSLSQNYPNPFNPRTKISWQSPVNSRQVLKVFDVLGNEVAMLVNEEKEAGYHSIDFNASELPSGVYFYQLKSGNFIETKKMMLLR